MGTIGRQLWLFAPAGLLLAADIALTLTGQPPAYWAGDYATAAEANPIAYPLLLRSPWLFVGGTFVWGLSLAAVILAWRHPAAAWVAVLAAVGHAIGGSSWLVRWGPCGWGVAAGYLIFASQASRWCWRRSGWLTAGKSARTDNSFF